MIPLQTVRYLGPETRDDVYPFSVPSISSLETLSFDSAVTFFVGENGTGKSTLLESIAAGIGSVVAGGQDIQSDPNLAPARALAERLRFTWRRKTRKGFFLRAEDFFNYARRTADTVAELGEMALEFERSYTGYGQYLARGAALGQREALVARYGEDLNARSHGESFLQFFAARFVPDGLYLLDEPDTPLSPQRELALLHILKDMVGQGAQFVIATHSPILMAFPDATILSFDRAPIETVAYQEVEQVTLTRSFLERPEAFLRQL